MLADKEKHKRSRRTAEICSIEELLPSHHAVRAIDAAVDWIRVYEAAERLYNADFGRPGVDPVVLVKIALIQHIFRLRSLRQTVSEIEINIAYRWFIGYSLLEKIPHFSTVSANFVRRIKGELFDTIFADVIDQVISGCEFDPEDVIYESPYLKPGDGFDRLVEKHLADDLSQVTIDSPASDSANRQSDSPKLTTDSALPAELSDDENATSGQISFAFDDD